MIATQPTTTTTQSTGSIGERAMLVDLNISQWSARKYDRKISDEVADLKGAERDAGRYNKALLSKEAIAEIRRIASQAFADHYRFTLPWLDSGQRILPSSLYFEYSQRMSLHRDKFEAAVASFEAGYPSFVDEARQRLNGMFDASEYPHPSEIRYRFRFGYHVFPLPDQADFRVNLGDAELARIRRELQASLDQALAEATNDIYQRVVKVVEHMASSLRDYRVIERDGKPSIKNPFRDSMIENVRELVSLLGALNVDGDPKLAEIAARMERELCVAEPQELRDNPKLRKVVKKSAEAILAEVSDFLA